MQNMFTSEAKISSRSKIICSIYNFSYCEKTTVSGNDVGVHDLVHILDVVEIVVCVVIMTNCTIELLQKLP